MPPPPRGDDVDVEAAGGEGDVEERDEGESDPSPGFFGNYGGDFQMRFLALEENKLEEKRRQREQQRELEMMRLEEQRSLREFE